MNAVWSLYNVHVVYRFCNVYYHLMSDFLNKCTPKTYMGILLIVAGCTKTRLNSDRKRIAQCRVLNKYCTKNKIVAFRACGCGSLKVQYNYS